MDLEFRFFQKQPKESKSFPYLISRIVNQHRQHQSHENVNQIKNKVKLMKLQHHQEQLNKLCLKFSDQQKRLNELNEEQGASSWLTI